MPLSPWLIGAGDALSGLSQSLAKADAEKKLAAQQAFENQLKTRGMNLDELRLQLEAQNQALTRGNAMWDRGFTQTEQLKKNLPVTYPGQAPAPISPDIADQMRLFGQDQNLEQQLAKQVSPLPGLQLDPSTFQPSPVPGKADLPTMQLNPQAKPGQSMFTGQQVNYLTPTPDQLMAYQTKQDLDASRSAAAQAKAEGEQDDAAVAAARQAGLSTLASLPAGTKPDDAIAAYLHAFDKVSPRAIQRAGGQKALIPEDLQSRASQAGQQERIIFQAEHGANVLDPAEVDAQADMIIHGNMFAPLPALGGRPGMARNMNNLAQAMQKKGKSLATYQGYAQQLMNAIQASGSTNQVALRQGIDRAMNDLDIVEQKIRQYDPQGSKVSTWLNNFRKGVANDQSNAEFNTAMAAAQEALKKVWGGSGAGTDQDLANAADAISKTGNLQSLLAQLQAARDLLRVNAHAVDNAGLLVQGGGANNPYFAGIYGGGQNLQGLQQQIGGQVIGSGGFDAAGNIITK